MDRPREQGEVAGKGSCEETGLANAITPRFSDLNNRLQPRVPIAESFCEMIRDKNGFGNDPPGRRGPCLAWSIPLQNIRTKSSPEETWYGSCICGPSLLTLSG